MQRALLCFAVSCSEADAKQQAERRSLIRIAINHAIHFL
jgi:hypothetical protein